MSASLIRSLGSVCRECRDRLAASRTTEQGDFGRFEMSPLANREASRSHGANRDSIQAHHLVTELREHPPDLAVLPFRQGHLDHGGVPLVPVLATDESCCSRPGFPFGKPDTLNKAVQYFGPRLPSDEDLVDLFDAKFGMGQPIREVTIVGQQDQPRALLVESSNRVDPLRKIGDQVNHPRTSGWVVISCEVALRFVDREVDGPLAPNTFAIDRNLSSFWVRFGCEVTDGLAIDRDSPLENKFFNRPSGT